MGDFPLSNDLDSFLNLIHRNDKGLFRLDASLKFDGYNFVGFKSAHTERVVALRTHSGHTIHCGHHSVIIVDIRNMVTTSDWLISLSRF